MIDLPSSAEVIAAHDAALAAPPVPAPADDVRGWVAVNHFHNRSLWAQEDLARRTLAPDAEIVANKRAIDRHNQARNDAIERIDEFLLAALGLVDPATLASALPSSTVPAGARLNSETAGSMLDRISNADFKRLWLNSEYPPAFMRRASPTHTHLVPPLLLPPPLPTAPPPAGCCIIPGII